MARAREQAEWLRVGWLIASIAPAVWTKVPIEPMRAIPEAYRPRVETRPLTEEERKAESKIAWHALGRAMRAMCGVN